MTRYILVTALLALLVSQLTAQITFQRTYGGASWDRGRSVTQTTDDGYVIAGYTRSFGAGGHDVYLVKTDASGDTIWTRAFGGANNDYAYSVKQTADGGYVIAGQTWSFGAGFGDVWLIKTDAAGDTIWTRTFGGASYDGGHSVTQTADDGYVVTGWTSSCGAGNYDVWLIKTDALGDTIWTHTYGGTSYDNGWSVAQTTDGGYIVTGYTTSFGDGDVWLIKTDSDGDTIWTRTYGGASSDEAYSVAQTADGGYVIAGWTYSSGGGNWNIYLVKTDASGDTMWTRFFGGEDFDRGWSVAQTADGGYVIVGETHSFGAGGTDLWLIKTDAWGDTMWTRTYGGADTDYGRSVAQTSDGGYVIAGTTWSFGTGVYDFWLIKTDSAGNSPAIAEPEPPVAHKPAGATIARAVLLLPEPAIRHSSFALLNCVGRKVMDLQPGENDVRHLSPGVYFVRSESTARPTKVIIQR
jgi:hypothetical protein